MQFNLLTIFPEILNDYMDKGMMRIAQEKKIIKYCSVDLRNFAVDKHGTVDDRPYGGGPGQVLMFEPVNQALKKIKAGKIWGKQNKKHKVILLSAKGKVWNQSMARRFTKFEQLNFICPRYEGHDERIKKLVDYEISIGDFVLTGGELGAAVMIDSITRLLPGVLGKAESIQEESHTTTGYLEYPQYTRPEEVIINNRKVKVPKILLSGHHEKINDWRRKNSQNIV